MKTFYTIVLVFLCSLISIVNAQERGLGVGVMLGDPSGLTAKYWTSDSNALDLGIGYSFVGIGSGLSIHLDYLYHTSDLFQSGSTFPIYYGFGIRFRFPQDEETVFGVRGVVGILWYPENLPVDLFLETAPSFRLLPDAAIDFSFGVGGRYYFTFNTSQ